MVVMLLNELIAVTIADEILLITRRFLVSYQY